MLKFNSSVQQQQTLNATNVKKQDANFPQCTIINKCHMCRIGAICFNRSQL